MQLSPTEKNIFQEDFGGAIQYSSLLRSWSKLTVTFCNSLTNLFKKSSGMAGN